MDNQGELSETLRGREIMPNLRKRVYTWLGITVAVAAGLLFLAPVTVSSAATTKGQAVEKPVQGQQLCPATPGAGPCKVILDCPAIRAPGKTSCQATIDCPPVKQPAKPKKQQK
jgi:hypothetical protein